MINSPPPYSDITGISRAVMKDNKTESLANYDGNARPGELVVNLESDPPEVYVGNNSGYLTLVASGGSDTGTFVADTLSSNIGSYYTWYNNDGSGYDTYLSSGNTTGEVGILSHESVFITSNWDNANYTWSFDQEGGFKSPIRTSAPSAPVTGAYYTCDGYLWNPASKLLANKPYPVFYDGTDYNALY